MSEEQNHPTITPEQMEEIIAEAVIEKQKVMTQTKDLPKEVIEKIHMTTHAIFDTAFQMQQKQMPPEQMVRQQFSMVECELSAHFVMGMQYQKALMLQ